MLIPEENAKDLADIPDTVKNGLEIVPVSMVSEVLKHALVRPLVPIEWDEEKEAAAAEQARKRARDEDGSGVVAH